MRDDCELVVAEIETGQPITGPGAGGWQGCDFVVRQIENIQPSQFGDVGCNDVDVVVCEVQVLHGELPVVGSPKWEVLKLVVTSVKVHLGQRDKETEFARHLNQISIQRGMYRTVGTSMQKCSARQLSLEQAQGQGNGGMKACDAIVMELNLDPAPPTRTFERHLPAVVLQLNTHCAYMCVKVNVSVHES